MTYALFDTEIDFSFAICPRRRSNKCIEQQDYDSCDETDYSFIDEDTSSVGSCRSVKFAEQVVSQVISVPRYEQDRKADLFYNKYDMMRFKQEARLERLHQVQVIW